MIVDFFDLRHAHRPVLSRLAAAGCRAMRPPSKGSCTSPTISSSRSSRVTRPAVPPNSSRVMAICWRRARMCTSRSLTEMLSGTNRASRASSRACRFLQIVILKAARAAGLSGVGYRSSDPGFLHTRAAWSRHSRPAIRMASVIGVAASTAMISVRGTLTWRTNSSPKSITAESISRSGGSITPSTSGPETICFNSSTEMMAECVCPLEGRPQRPSTRRVAQSRQENKAAEYADKDLHKRRADDRKALWPAQNCHFWHLLAQHDMEAGDHQQ